MDVQLTISEKQERKEGGMKERKKGKKNEVKKE
jgi:hypothetical protein